MSFKPEDPRILTCGDCNREVYRATKDNYSKDALRKAVHEHARVCPNRQLKPQEKEAHEA